MGELVLREDLDRVDLADLDSGIRLAPVPPGDVLRLDFMEPLGVSATGLARRAGIPTNRITAILHGERAITADTALLLADEFGTTPEFWMNLQTAHDLELARGRKLVAA